MAAQQAHRYTSRYVALALNVGLLIFAFALLGPSFFSTATMATMTPVISVAVIASLGQAFVVATGGFDISVASTISLMGIIMLKATNGENSQLVGGIAVGLVACLLIGLVNGLLVEVLGLSSIVVTLAVGQVVAGVAVLYAGPILNVGSVPSLLMESARSSTGFGLSYILVAAVILCLIIFVGLRSWIPGRQMTASSSALLAAEMVGFPGRTYRVGAYVLASLMFGIAGIILAGQRGTPDLNLGSAYLLTTFVAAIVGSGSALVLGIVDPFGAALGAVFLTLLISVLAAHGFSGGTQTLASGVVLAVGLSIPSAAAWLRARATPRQRAAKLHSPI